LRSRDVPIFDQEGAEVLAAEAAQPDPAPPADGTGPWPWGRP